jgi:hypothetical protein
MIGECTCVVKKDYWSGNNVPAYEEEMPGEVKLTRSLKRHQFIQRTDKLFKAHESSLKSNPDEGFLWGQRDGLYVGISTLSSPVHDHVAPLLAQRYLLFLKHVSFHVRNEVIEYLGMLHGGRYSTFADFKTSPEYEKGLVVGLNEAKDVFESLFGRENMVVWVMQYYFHSHQLNLGLEYAKNNMNLHSRVAYWRDRIISYCEQFHVPELTHKRVLLKWDPSKLKSEIVGEENVRLSVGMNVELVWDRPPHGYYSSSLQDGPFGLTKEMMGFLKEGQKHTITGLYQFKKNKCFLFDFDQIKFDQGEYLFPIRSLRVQV